MTKGTRITVIRGADPLPGVVISDGDDFVLVALDVDSEYPSDPRPVVWCAVAALTVVT